MGSVSSSKTEARITRCPLELTGRNSVIPCKIARISNCQSSNAVISLVEMCNGVKATNRVVQVGRHRVVSAIFSAILASVSEKRLAEDARLVLAAVMEATMRSAEAAATRLSYSQVSGNVSPYGPSPRFVISEVLCVTGVSVPDLLPPFCFLFPARQTLILV